MVSTEHSEQVSDFTENQRQAIERKGNVLVVAGAGTGKTRTLVQRCVEWLLQAPGQNSLDQILMVTFTEAAAAEMRQRIRDELKKQLTRPGLGPFLLEQLALLDTAFISTLHSFCFRLVRQHFYELELDPQLAILPAEEAQLLAAETLSSILERHYAGHDPASTAVQQLIQVQARGWDLPIRRLVQRLHEYAQTLPDPSGWFSQQFRLLSSEHPEVWRRWLEAALPEWATTWLPVLAESGSGVPNVVRCLEALGSLPNRPTLKDWDAALACIQTADAGWPRGTIGKVRDRIESFFDEASFLRGLTSPCAPLRVPDGEDVPEPDLEATAQDDPLRQDWSWVRPHMITLLELTAEFGREYAAAKRELGVVDFHDLEQFSLRLLWNPAEHRATPLAEQWRARLRLVFVDEYQDINAAQDAILRALSREGTEANRFLVGDPKQSIYRFRLADPHIFQAYTETWRQQPALGHLIPLQENFRSHEGILHFVNAFFSQVMKREIGGVAYDELSWLQFGQAPGRAPLRVTSSPGPEPSPRVELHLRLTAKHRAEDNEDEEESGENLGLSSVEREARLIGQRLISLRDQSDGAWDSETSQYRRLTWSDIVILLRSPQRKVEAYAKEFARLGIPLVATRGGFFDSPEVMDLLSLLRLLDNPLQDVPLLSVLRSPLTGLTLDELALIRLAAPGRLWAALQHFHHYLSAGPVSLPPTRDTGDAGATATPHTNRLRSALARAELREKAEMAWPKVDLFLRRFAEWRRAARQVSLSECLDRILRETQYISFVLAQPRAQQRRANLSKLQTWARRFDQYQRQGLFRFLKFIEAQAEAGLDAEPAPPDAQDAVRLMSIHQSKGLEFPVVVIGDLGKSFNLIDLKGDVILDEQYGLCPLVKPPFSQQRYPSVPHWLAQRRQREETLGEEMRLLYVAMTRACDRLILVGTASRAAATRWSEGIRSTLNMRDLTTARSYLDWLGPWIATHGVVKDGSSLPEGKCPLFQWTIASDDEPNPSMLPAEREAEPDGPGVETVDAEAWQRLLERVHWRYPLQTANTQPAKSSVSTLRQSILAELDDESPKRRARWSGRRGPSLEKLTAAEIGVAHHTFLQFVSLEQVRSRESLHAEAVRLESELILSPAERATLNLDALASFWRSAVGRLIYERRQFVQRELPFTFRLPASEALVFQAHHLAVLREHLGDEAGGKVGQSARRKPASRRSEPVQLTEPQKPVAQGVLDSDFVVLTGVVDLAVLLENEVWFLDFKTDEVTREESQAKVLSYQPQIELYAAALSQIYRRPVTHGWLHFFSTRETVEVVSRS